METTRLGSPPPERIAVVRALRGLGDMLCSVPAFRALRVSFPEARITLIGLPSAAGFRERFSVYCDDLLEFPGFPGIPEVPYRPAALAGFISAVQGEFDVVLQLHGSGTNSNAFALLLGAKVTAGCYLPSLWCPDPDFFLPYPAHAHEIHRWLELLQFLGVPNQGDQLEFPAWPEDSRQLEESWPQWQDGGPYACIHPGAFEPERRWPAERFAAVGDALAAEGYTIVLTGVGAEQELTSRVAASMSSPPVDLAGRTGLGALATLLGRASLLVCNDTGVSHLAVAVGTPSVVIFSASDHGRWGPLDRRRHRVVGQVKPKGRNSCLHTAEIGGHRCLRDACSSLSIAGAESWQPESVEAVLGQAFDLLRGDSR